MKAVIRYKSVRILPADRLGKTGLVMFDMDTIKDHLLEAGPRLLFLNRSWISTVLISIMILVPLFALIYGIAAIGFNVNMRSATPVVIFAFIVALVLLASAMGYPASIRRLKWDLVVKERGGGNWKLVDDSEWERFTRMIQIAEEQKRKEKEKLEKEMAKKHPSWPPEK